MSLDVISGAIQAYSIRQDVTANNLANISTTGFKQSTVSLADTSAGGVQVAAITPDTGAGSLVYTGSSNDYAARGNGYFQVTARDGQPAYLRDGAFQLDAAGNLNKNGQPVMLDDAGQPAMARFTNSAGLSYDGGNRLRATANSGPAIQDDSGFIPGYLESSNTDTVTQTVDMLQNSAAFKLYSAYAHTDQEMHDTLMEIVA